LLSAAASEAAAMSASFASVQFTAPEAVVVKWREVPEAACNFKVLAGFEVEKISSSNGHMPNVMKWREVPEAA